MEVMLKYVMPEEREELDCALNGAKYLAALCDIDSELRAISKHGREGFDHGTVALVRDLFYASLGDIDIW